MRAKLIIYAIALAWCAMLLPLQAQANGGPIAWTAITPFSSLAVKPMQQKSIALMREDLAITITGVNTYHVKAVYKLKNTGQTQKVSFGIPMHGDLEPMWEEPNYDEIEDYIEIENNDPDNKLVGNEAERWEKAQEYLAKIKQKADKASPAIKIKHNLTDVQCKFARAAGFKDKVTDSNDEHEYIKSVNAIKGWCVADGLVFNANSESTVTMEYDTELGYVDEAYTKSPDPDFGDRILQYYFFPAGYWSGAAAEVHITLDPGIYSGFANVISPQAAKPESGKYVWDLKNVNLKALPKLEVVLDKKLAEQSYLNKSALNGWTWPYSVSASSTLKPMGNVTYNPSHLSDKKSATAWCEGVPGDGVGQWLRFKLKELPPKDQYGNDLNCRLSGILIAPGYMKNESTYLTNGRVKAFRVSECGSKDSVILRAPSNDKYFFATGYFNMDYEFINNILEGEDPCLKFEILEVTPGTTGDTCISEIAIKLNCN